MLDPSRTHVATRVGPGADRSRGEATPARVVDLSSLWAGPLCGRLLAALGMEVVKVESTTRPDGARRGSPAFFDHLNGDKRHLALPLASTEGRRALADLLTAADVVIEGSRPRALEQMGIEPAAVVAGGPGRVWVSITAYGRTGPWRNRVGFGDDAAAAGGLVRRDADGVPTFVGDAVADPLAGLVAAAAAASSWAAGGGAVVDVALREVARAAASTPGRDREDAG
nr:CoA transferase [Rhabdothermincola salaria]